jgi:hypothetical protein
MFYKKLDIANLQNIQNKIIPYVTDFVTKDVELSEEKFGEKISFNHVSNEDLEKFKEDIPELFECIRRELGSEVPLMAYVCIDEIRTLPIHTDGDNSIERRIRLHWPILNTKSAETIYYKKKNEDVQSTHVVYKSNVNGYRYNLDDLYEVDRYVLDVPTLNSVKEVHGVELIDSKLPRILLTMRLSNEDYVYQKHF